MDSAIFLEFIGQKNQYRKFLYLELVQDNSNKDYSAVGEIPRRLIGIIFDIQKHDSINMVGWRSNTYGSYALFCVL